MKIKEVTDTAQTVLEARYFQPGETRWSDVCDRVAKAFATTQEEEKVFYDVMFQLNFLPNSPTLMNAGTEITSYSACFVLPIEDNIESIFKYYSDAGLISKSGGGVGCNFSSLRPTGDTVGSTGGVASGPVSFMKGQDALTEVIKQGGKRRGANMGILDCDHPDVMDLVTAKDTPGVLENFNLSVRVTDEFMETVTQDEVLTGKEDYHKKAAKYALWNEMMIRAHSSGEPGVLFGDAIERGNTVPHLGPLTITNPCGEQPLLPYESCCLGSINLSNHVCDSGVNWDKLQTTTETAVLLLNRVLDKSVFPVEECNEAMRMTRKIGSGIMGLHDMLIQMGLPYDSGGGREVAGRVMEFIAKIADAESKRLGKSEGCYWSVGSESPARRNANLTTIAPTGTLSMIADCSSGCEPYFSMVTKKTVLDGTEFIMKNKWVTHLTDPELLKGAQDIHWRDHVLMQAALQKHVDSSISKTINMPHDATVADVKEAYELAWNLDCKGLTIYRDGSRSTQVLTTRSPGDDSNSSGVDHDTEQSDSSSEGPHTRDHLMEQPTPYKLELPDELDAKRYRIRDNNGDKIYVTVCSFDDDPVEMFIKHPLELPNGYLSTVSRLVTLALRYNVPLDDVTKALRKGSTSVADTPAKLARILDRYKTEGSCGIVEGVPLTPESELGYQQCPECEAWLVHEGGCVCCKTCGWEKCS